MTLLGREAARTGERLHPERPDAGTLHSSSRKLSTEVRAPATPASAPSTDPTSQSYIDSPALRSGPSLLEVQSLIKPCLSRGRVSGHTHLAFHRTFQHTLPPRPDTPSCLLVTTPTSSIPSHLKCDHAHPAVSTPTSIETPPTPSLPSHLLCDHAHRTVSHHLNWTLLTYFQALNYSRSQPSTSLMRSKGKCPERYVAPLSHHSGRRPRPERHCKSRSGAVRVAPSPDPALQLGAHPAVSSEGKEMRREVVVFGPPCGSPSSPPRIHVTDDRTKPQTGDITYPKPSGPWGQEL